MIFKTVYSFIYLRSKISSGGKSWTGIISRIAQVKHAFNKKINFFIASKYEHQKNTNKKPSVALYELETWAILKTERAKIEGFEVWYRKKALRISWTNKVRNVRVL